MLEDALVNSVNPINTGIRSIFISIDILKVDYSKTNKKLKKKKSY